MSKGFQPLNIDKIFSFIDEGGRLSHFFKNYEKREGQREILAKMVQAFNENAVALIEAGTGTGKSIAYLIPALLSAVLWKNRVVISTHTIALQEQLINKDLPVLLKALNIEIKVVLVKGMNNYLCLRKCEEIGLEKALFSEKEQGELDRIEALAFQEKCGARSELPFHPSQHIWEIVSADHESCNGPDCYFHSRCPYIAARKYAQDAQIFIVNHHLLFSDLVVRAETQNYTTAALLPPYQRLIIDEAHHLEEIATNFFANRVSRLELFKIASKASCEKQGKIFGKVAMLKEKMQKIVKNGIASLGAPLPEILLTKLPAAHATLLKEIGETFQDLEHFLEEQTTKVQGEENKLRLRSHHYELKVWKETVSPKIKTLSHSLKSYAMQLKELVDLIESQNENSFNDAIKSILFDIKSLVTKLQNDSGILEAFATDTLKTEHIRWLETNFSKRGHNCVCIEAVLDVSKLIFKYVCTPFETVAFLSATLSTQGSFSYIKERFGISNAVLSGRQLLESSVNSPFDYQKQALLIIPKDIVPPTDSQFLSQSQNVIWSAIQASKGNAFVLFTSYDALKKCYDGLSEKLKAERFIPLKQGDEQRQLLLKRFMEKERSVLFGTDSFWEGVDVVGDALRLVIIAKLPFKVPVDPLVQARSEVLAVSGKEPFYEFILPQAAIKLKQGFGRLIRNKKDRGCILCLDNRLITKSYGQYLIKTLPDCPCIKINMESLREEMSNFYRKTGSLTRVR